MNILGISPFGENPAACLVIDGEMRSFCMEERLTRLKGSFGHFPSRAVTWALRGSGLKLSDIGRIAVAWDCTKYPWAMLRHLAGVRMGLRKFQPDPSSLAHPNGNGEAWRYL